MLLIEISSDLRARAQQARQSRQSRHGGNSSNAAVTNLLTSMMTGLRRWATTATDADQRLALELLRDCESDDLLKNVQWWRRCINSVAAENDIDLKPKDAIKLVPVVHKATLTKIQNWIPNEDRRIRSGSQLVEADWSKIFAGALDAARVITMPGGIERTTRQHRQKVFNRLLALTAVLTAKEVLERDDLDDLLVSNS